MMNIKINFKELRQPISLQFKEVISVSDGGYEKGYDEGYVKGTKDGYSNGYDTGVGAGYEKGSQDRNFAIMDSFQQQGTRTNYKEAFRGWTASAFVPVYDINVVSEASYAFYNLGEVDLISYCNDTGISINTSKATDLAHAFRLAKIPTLSTISVESVTKTDGLHYMIADCSNLHTIEKIVFHAEGKNPNMYYLLWNCPKLVNINACEGIIGRSINLSASKLISVDSLVNIMKHYRDFTGTAIEFGYTLTLSDESKALLDAENVQIDGVPWRDYMANKCMKIA